MSDPNIFVIPNILGEIFTVWATQRTVFYPNFFCEPQHFGENFTVWATQRTVFHPNFFCDHKILEALSRSKKEEAL